MEDSIPKLKNFSKMDLRSKQEVVKNGRPTPELKGFLTPGRSFQSEWYTRKDWLCGSATENRLYCFPCLLFSTSEHVWTQTGYCDMKNLPRSLCKHERSTSHIQSQIALKTFGPSRIDVALDEQRKLDVSLHNARVKENREVLKDLINATCLLAKQQLAFGANDKSSSNRGNFVELLYVFAEKDERLARHLETSTVFCGNTLQDNLIEAVADVIRNDIKGEIKAVPFVAVEIDERTDVSNKANIAVILRYVAKTEVACEIKEAFLGIDDVSADACAPAVTAEHVLGLLDKYNCLEKLAAQTYDGPHLNGVRDKIIEKVPEAMSTHCHAHDLNLVLQHSAKCTPTCRTFFNTIEGLGAFFAKSTKRSHFLDTVVKRRSPKAATPTTWSSDSRVLLQTISKYQEDLRSVFRAMNSNPDNWDNESVMVAAGYDGWLSEASTCFLIMAYEEVLKETDALFQVPPNKAMDVGYCRECILDTVVVLDGMQQEFDTFYERFAQKCAALGLMDDESSQSVRDERRRVFSSILDNISDQMKARFDHFEELAFLGLVDCAKFKEMSQHFDEPKLQSLKKYAKFFDLVRLKADLVGLYSSQTVRKECKLPGQLLTFLVQKDLVQTVPEATKLLQLVLTILAPTSSGERLSWALKRLRTFSGNGTDQGRLPSLAIISMEAERLLKLREEKEEFYKRVTDLFVQKDQRSDFIFR